MDLKAVLKLYTQRYYQGTLAFYTYLAIFLACHRVKFLVDFTIKIITKKCYYAYFK